MAAVVNVSSKKAAKGGGTSLTSDAFTVGGSNRALYVLAFSGASAAVVCTGVKWGGSGGTSLTKIGDSSVFAGFGYATLWRLIAPAATTDTVYATWGSSQDERMLICIAVEDADQSTPNGTVASGSSSSNSPSLAAAAVVGDLVLNFLALMDNDSTSKTLTAGATSDQEIEGLEGGNLDGYECAGGQHDTAASTSHAMSWTIGGRTAPNAWVYQFSFAVNAAAGGGGPTGSPWYHYANQKAVAG